MPNPYFKFKQFTVYHDRCAMKVGTDGVLLGAWVNMGTARTALDAGTGTGLISLMLAQRNPSIGIKAIDIDAGAIEQTEYNILNSPFYSRISHEYISVQDLANRESNAYDLIVSNPPFFSRSLKSPDEQRSIARHTDTLPLEELIASSAKLLSPQGRLALIYPYTEKGTIIEAGSKNGLYCNRITNVYPTPDSLPKRILIELSKISMTQEENDLVIETDRHIYSEAFTNLVKEFYLKT